MERGEKVGYIYSKGGKEGDGEEGDGEEGDREEGW